MIRELLDKLLALFILPIEVRSFKDLEDHVWEKGLELLRWALGELLREMDDALFKVRPSTLKPRDFRVKRIDTVVGTVTIVRRRYRDANGRYVYLLDEALGLQKRQRLSPGIIIQCVEQATEMSFRRVVEQRREVGLASPSHGSVHSWTREMGERRSIEDAEARRLLFEQGEVTGEALSEAEVLFHEVDGIFVHAQHEEQDRLEIKAHMIHMGWEPRYGPGGTGLKLKGRRVYACIAEDADSFWEESLANHGRRIDLSSVRVHVLNGDGAGWIDSGKDYLPECYRQLDRYHVFRDIRKAFPDDEAKRLIEAIRSGQIDAVIDTIEGSAYPDLPKETRKRRTALWLYLKNHQDALRDYREQLKGVLPADQIYGGMGAAEGSVDKSIANRMKKRGMSWTRKGADAMARLRSLRINGELRSWLIEQFEPSRKNDNNDKPAIQECVKRASRLRDKMTSWLDRAIPALSGSSSGSSWVKVLRQLATPRFEVV